MAEINYDSILNSVKKDLGISPEYTVFDPDLILDINTAFSYLTQIGVGPKEGFDISGSEEEWTDFIEDDPRMSMFKKYVSMKTKLLFDSNNMTGPVIQAINDEIKQIEWRMVVQMEDLNE